MKPTYLIIAILAIGLFLPSIIYSQGDNIAHDTDYIEGNIIGVAAHAPNQNSIYLMNMGTNVLTPEQQWVTVDVSGQVPPDTKSIFTTIMFAVTHGQTPETCAMYLYLRKYGEGTEWGVAAKANIVDTAGGVREGYSHWIPLSADHKFQLKWYRGTTGDYPQHCAYGFNIWLEGYLRGGAGLQGGMGGDSYLPMVTN